MLGDLPKFIKPAIMLIEVGPAPTKIAFGGLPNLPERIDWPRCKKGLPLHFLAQFDLASLPRQHEERGQIFELPEFPETGTLFIFASMNDQEFTTKPSTAFIYVPESIEQNPERTPPADTVELVDSGGENSKHYFDDSYAVDSGLVSKCGKFLERSYCRVETDLSFRIDSSLRLDLERAERGSEPLNESYESDVKHLEALGIVKDLRAEDDANPKFDFREIDREKDMEQMFGKGYVLQSAAVEHDDKVLLLQIERVSGIDLDYPSGGITQCWIEPADLAAGRFEKAFMTFECN